MQVVKCPRCGNTNHSVVENENKNFSYKKAIIGTLVLGPVGAAAGIGGKKETQRKMICQNCGYSWDVGSVRPTYVSDKVNAGTVVPVLPQNKDTELSSVSLNYVDLNCILDITSYTITKDEAGNVKVKFKMFNYSERKVSAIKIAATGYNSFNDVISIDDKSEFIILIQDMNIKSHSEGASEYIKLPSIDIRKLEIVVSQVVYGDSDIFVNEAPCVVDRVKGEYINKNYLTDVSPNISVYPQDMSEMWLCACNRLNKSSDDRCVNCGKQKDFVLENYCQTALKAKYDVRCEEERQRREKEEAERLEKEKADKLRAEQLEQERIEKERIQKEKNKKTAKIAVSCILAVTVVIVGVVLCNNVIIPEINYSNAQKLFENGQYDEAIEAFAELGNYKDSGEKILSTKYEKANNLANLLQYDEAVALYNELGDYLDSKDKILSVKYEKANDLFVSSKYDEAIAVFKELADYSNSKEQVLASYYAKGIALRAEDKFDEAIKAFVNAKNYRDADEQIYEIYYEKDIALYGFKYASTIIGETIICGSYEQDNDLSNGNEPLEWIVLDKKNGELLLISKYCLECKRYNDENAYIDWETCTVGLSMI